MNFTFDSYNQINTPRLFLAYPNRKRICWLNARGLKTALQVVGVSSASFNMYKYNGLTENKGFEEISIGKYVYIEYIGWFRITDIKKKLDGDNPYLEITCYDLAIELSQTYLTSFGSMGTEDDAQGGLDRYALYNADDQQHSIAHIFMAKNPGWTFKYIDDDISKNHRSFDNDSVTSYQFLTDDVSEAFECVFTFDGNDRTVSAYSIENLGTKLPIILSFRNLIKEIEIKWDENDVKTMLNVSGGNDATGTALSIASVNPSGNSIITNLTYFYKDMSTELKEKLEEYYTLMEDSEGLITTASSELKTLQDELLDLNNKEPSVESSTDWSEYGLVALKAKASEYKGNMSAISDIIGSNPTAKQQYDNYNALWNAVNEEITVRQNEISAKESAISAKKTEISSYAVNINTVLGDDLYKELQPFIREDTLCDTSYIVTSSMTESEIVEMKQDLYGHAVEELNRVCYPQFDMTIDAMNFPTMKKYEGWTNKLNLGDILTIKYSDDVTIQARLLKMELNWEDFSDFSLTFSSKTSVDDGYFLLEEIRKLADASSSTLDYKTSGWNGASVQANEAYYATMKDYLDLSMQQIVSNGVNQEVEMDGTGILLKKWLPDENKYAPEKMWITNRQLMLYEEEDGTNLKTPKLAIGKVYVTKNGVTTSYYGSNGEIVYGKMFFGESLTIQNTNNTLTMDENGFKALATNGFSVKINPDTPDDIFTISENGTKLMYIDAVNKKLVFKGRIEANEGLIGNWTIGTNALTSGGVGMSSDTASGAIAFWAGNVIPAIAPFWVNNLGKLHASDVEITGGSLTIGSNFSVDNSGRLTAESVNIRNGSVSMADGVFEADENGVMFGDYYVSADGTSTLNTVNGYFSINSFHSSTGPGGDYAEVNIGGSESSGIILRGTGQVYCGGIESGDIKIGTHQDFWNGWTITQELILLHNQVFGTNYEY